MNARLTAVASLLAILSLAPVAALAQAPADSPRSQPVAPGPQGPSDISMINGQLVKVGEHNDYHYSFKRLNISSNPVGWMLGFYGVSASYALSDHVAVRGDANVFNDIFGDGESGTEFGVGVPLYLRRTYQGPFIEPGAIARHYGDSSTIGPQMLVGWHWTWDSGFNMAIAAGFGRDILGEDDDHYDDYDDGAEVFGNGYFRVGYAF